MENPGVILDKFRDENQSLGSLHILCKICNSSINPPSLCCSEISDSFFFFTKMGIFQIVQIGSINQKPIYQKKITIHFDILYTSYVNVILAACKAF